MEYTPMYNRQEYSQIICSLTKNMYKFQYFIMVYLLILCIFGE